MNLRERCEKLYDLFPEYSEHYSYDETILDLLQTFAREIRNEALESCGCDKCKREIEHGAN